MKGYIHIYTGNGKGKTTAAFGLAMRATGASKKVFIAQFVKGKMYSEIKTVQQHLPSIEIKQYGLGCFIEKDPTPEDISAARNGLEECTRILTSNKYDMIILDEVFIAIFFRLFSVDDLITLIQNKPSQLELIMTGRYAPLEIIDLADLVTEMKEIKHYYNKGIEAREGIEY
jgi:cob(I)alamin adenosyltransferase